MYTVMIVDDEPLIRESIAYTVEDCAADVRVVSQAANGREALDAFITRPVDIVLTDIRMPVMDGLELIRRLREEDDGVQIVILSGYAEFEYARRAMHYGVNGYVLKPIKTADLKKEIDDCISKCPPRASEAEKSVVHRICETIQTRFAQPLRLEELAAEFGFSAKHLSYMVKGYTGKNFSDYLIDLRIEHAMGLLLNTGIEIKEVAARAGYDDVQYFTRLFKRKTGLTPGRYRYNRL